MTSLENLTQFLTTLHDFLDDMNLGSIGDAIGSVEQ